MRDLFFLSSLLPFSWAIDIFATSYLQPIGNFSDELSGTVLFHETSYMTSIIVNITGLLPNSVHGFHIHELGDVSDYSEGKASGGHYNPTLVEHTCPSSASPSSEVVILDNDVERHVGDLGNLEADASGNVNVLIQTSLVKINPSDSESVLGRAVVLHERADDCVSQPSGAAGRRMLQGVIGWGRNSDSVVMDDTLGVEAAEGLAVIQRTSVPTGQQDILGTVTFKQLDDSVKVMVKLSNLTPKTNLALHVHEFGDISASDGKATGGHFNPFNTAHGCISKKGEHHAGDIGNIKTDKDGSVDVELTLSHDQLVLFPKGDNFAIGRGVILHEGADDCVSQPTGNAGGRLGQGVIGRSNGKTGKGSPPRVK